MLSKRASRYESPFKIFDENLAIAPALKVMETPTMVLVTHSGKVLWSHSGEIKDLDRSLRRI